MTDATLSYALQRTVVDGLEVVFVAFDHLGVPHGSSTRVGGVSEGAFACMNVGRHSGDDLERVAENRRRLGQALGIEVPATLQMSHGREVAVLRTPEEGRGAHPGDACITDHPEVSMSLTTADCVPVLLADPGRGVVGLAHAGWRGTVLKVAQATVEAMRTHFNCRAQDLRVGIGPAIGPCCFLVDEDVSVPFGAEFPQLVERAGEKWRADLPGANRAQLIEAGVDPSQIAVCDLCTSCRADLFFSYRRDRRVTGRMAAAIRPA